MQKPIHKRKNRHLDICLDPPESIEPQDPRFSEIHLVPRAFPEHDYADINTSCEFAGQQIAMPVIILPMTGGTHQGLRLNEVLIEAAQECKLPVGFGSMRIFLENEADEHYFKSRHEESQMPIIANIGAVELKRHSFKRIFHCCEQLRADVLSVHINVAQELMQENGDTEFSGLIPAIAQLHAESPIPILVKETGFGIDPQSFRTLSEIGIEYIDISGSGGSNWAVIEALSQHRSLGDEHVEFYKQWGMPTAVLLRVLYSLKRRKTTQKHHSISLPRDEGTHFSLGTASKVIASGGVRSVHDMVVCLASGAQYVGMALPLIRRAANHGVDGVVTYLKQLQRGLQYAMLSVGAVDIQELQSCMTWCDAALEQEVGQIVAECLQRG